MSTYSFNDIAGAFNGPGGSINVGADAGAGEGGITVAAVNDANTMTIGAGGDGMHSMRNGDPATVTIRFLKTSPTNARLMTMYNLQKAIGSSAWGRNTLTFRDTSRGDSISLTKGAFKRVPDINYAVEGGEIEWTFDFIASNIILGVGTPELG